MKIRIVLAALSLPFCSATAGFAAPGGALGTIEPGKWFCEVPGDAAAPAKAVPAENFTAIKDSSYRAADGSEGHYLLLGEVLTMTSGALRGNRYALDSQATIRKLGPGGEPIALRCVRAGDPAANTASVDPVNPSAVSGQVEPAGIPPAAGPG